MPAPLVVNTTSFSSPSLPVSITLSNGSQTGRALAVFYTRRRNPPRPSFTVTFNDVQITAQAHSSVGTTGNSEPFAGIAIFYDSDLPATSGAYSLTTQDAPGSLVVVELSDVDSAAPLIQDEFHALDGAWTPPHTFSLSGVDANYLTLMSGGLVAFNSIDPTGTGWTDVTSTDSSEAYRSLAAYKTGEASPGVTANDGTQAIASVAVGLKGIDGGSGISGSGSPQAEDATATGSGIREITSSASVQSENATASGEGTVGNEITGSGSPQAEPATVSGTGTRSITGSADVQSQIANVSGTGIRIIIGSGAPQAANSSSSGQADRIITASAAVQAENANASGTSVAEEIRVRLLPYAGSSRLLKYLKG